MKDKKRFLFRLIVPAFPEVNIFTSIAKKTTALGPVMVATAASKLWGWDVEVIDENNCRRAPKDKKGLVDHRELQMQKPADMVGFYGSLSSTMSRVWKLADFYSSCGAITIAGGRHVGYAPRESLGKDIDVVVLGDGEETIKKILISIQENKSYGGIPGISFLQDNSSVRTLKTSGELLSPEQLSLLPYPDFGIVHFAKIKVYPIGRVRGCSYNCEFCTVNDKPRCADGDYLFGQVEHLVETRRAKEFFVVDDRFGEDRENTMLFLERIAKKYGRSLDITVQPRLESAEDAEFLKAMYRAGVRVVCIGFESPIDSELKAMQKCYPSKDVPESSEVMLKWARLYHKHKFMIHGMFIFGYPLPKGLGEDSEDNLRVEDKIRIFKKFIRRARIDTIQVLRPIPLIGSPLRERLGKEDKLIPLETVPWQNYDGSYVCFRPDNMTMRELQEAPLKIMRGFYHWYSCLRIGLRTILFPIDYLVRGWHLWFRGWRNDIKRFGGFWVVVKWIRKNHKFIKNLEKVYK